jgi:hypothetical protein
MAKGVLISLYTRRVLRTVLRVGPGSGSGAGFAWKDGGKNGTAVPRHHCYQHLHAGRDGGNSIVHAIRQPQSPAVSSLSSGGMRVAHIKANRITPANSTMARLPKFMVIARSLSVSSVVKFFSAEALF